MILTPLLIVLIIMSQSPLTLFVPPYLPLAPPPVPIMSFRLQATFSHLLLFRTQAKLPLILLFRPQAKLPLVLLVRLQAKLFTVLLAPLCLILMSLKIVPCLIYSPTFPRQSVLTLLPPIYILDICLMKIPLYLRSHLIYLQQLAHPKLHHTLFSGHHLHRLVKLFPLIALIPHTCVLPYHPCFLILLFTMARPPSSRSLWPKHSALWQQPIMFQEGQPSLRRIS